MERQLALWGERPRLLDLFCGAGGSGYGYWLAGWDVLGVDLVPQPDYPLPFVLADALTFPLDGYDAIHASPPCQPYSTTRTLHGAEYPQLVDQVRARLRATGVPYVVENVVGAPLENCVTLCGSSFGLPVWRHRRFETNWTVWNPPRCEHDRSVQPIDVTGGGPSVAPRMDGAGGRSRKPRDVAEARAALGIPWAGRRGLNAAVPPAYTEWLGARMIQACAGG